MLVANTLVLSPSQKNPSQGCLTEAPNFQGESLTWLFYKCCK